MKLCFRWYTAGLTVSNILCYPIRHHVKFASASELLINAIYLPAVSCLLISAPFFSKSSAILAIPSMTSFPVTSGLKQATMCSGVSLSRCVHIFTLHLLLMRKLAENSSPKIEVITLSNALHPSQQFFCHVSFLD